MALIEVNGDLLKSDCTIIAHCANCQETMGAGIAKDIRATWPMVYLADQVFYPKQPQAKFGKASSALVDRNSRVIYNLYGQLRYGRDSKQLDEDKLISAMAYMLDDLCERNLDLPYYKIGIPGRIGCFNAGGDWSVVSKLVHDFSEARGIDIHAFHYRR